MKVLVLDHEVMMLDH